MKLATILIVGSLFVACSSEETKSTPAVPCNKDPWQCPAGQTCWPKDQAGTFACLNSAAGVGKGAECLNTLGAPTCGDGLACFQGVGDAKGRCVTFCDPAKAGRGCGAGETCTPVTLAGTSQSFMVCIGAAPPPADTGVDTGPTDTGTADTGKAEAATDAMGD